MVASASSPSSTIRFEDTHSHTHTLDSSRCRNCYCKRSLDDPTIKPHAHNVVAIPTETSSTQLKTRGGKIRDPNACSSSHLHRRQWSSLPASDFTGSPQNSIVRTCGRFEEICCGVFVVRPYFRPLDFSFLPPPCSSSSLVFIHWTSSPSSSRCVRFSSLLPRSLQA